MELALHLGRPAGELARSMTEVELQQWAQYARRKALPYHRLELMLAQLSMLIARTMGGVKDAKVADFMLKEPEDEMPANVTRIEVARAAFGFAPRKKKKA